MEFQVIARSGYLLIWLGFCLYGFFWPLPRCLTHWNVLHHSIQAALLRRLAYVGSDVLD
jgi:hypothetical protein